MAEQVTKMVIKVDLQCHRCYKKIKKILCEIPQVKDQSFDEKQNKVTITVVSCRPEEVRQKICCKGRDCILGIDIITPEKVTKDESSKETKKPGATQDGPAKKPVPPPPVYVMGLVNVCPPCHNQGCGWLCPCICHCGRPPMCDDGCGRPAHECRCGRPPHECRCGRPPMCHDGCGRPAHECRCGRPPMCQDGCGRPAHECRCWRPPRPPMCQDGCGRPAHECRCWRPPMCQDGCGRPAHECRCWRPPMCQDGCGRPAHECRCWRPPMCQDGCGRPAHECRCRRPIYCGRPPVCTNAGYDCESSCLHM